MRRHAPLIAVALTAVAVRAPGAFAHALWQDEVASARILSEPTLARAVVRVAHTESTPPLWYVLAWLLHHAGVGIVETRLLSVAAAGVAAGGAFALARRLGGTGAGLGAGLLLACSEQLAVYGESLRAYALLVALAALFALAVLDAAAEPTRRRLAVVGALAAAGMWTHYFFALTILAALVWLARQPGRVRVGGAIGAGAATLLAWSPELARQVHNGRTWWIGAFRFRNVLAAPLRLYTFTLNGTTPGRMLGVLVFLVLAAAAAIVARERAGRLAVALVFVPVVVAATAWAAGLKVYALRNLLEIAPFAAVVLSVAAARVRLQPAVLTLAAALGVALAFSEAHRVPAYDAMAHRLVASGWTPAVPIAVPGDPLRFRGPIEWYLPGRPVLVPAAGRCTSVLALSERGRVRHVAATPEGSTLLVVRGAAPACARVLPARHAALA